MQRQPLDSTSLMSAGYDKESQTLEVEFRNHRVYRYMDVPADVYEGLTTADSAGSYFSRNIRNNYECWRFVSGPRDDGR